MQARAGVRHATRRRGVVVLAALALLGAATAPAAMAKVTPRPHVTPPKPPQRTGMIVSACSFSHRSNDDPIVYPGLPGVSHLHDFFGNVSTDANSTLASLSGQKTSCGVAGDTAAYRAPTRYGNGVAAHPAGIFAYYAVFGSQPVHTLPIGLEMVAKGSANVRFSCFRHSMPTAAYVHMPVCKANDLMSIGVNFPSCWNGTDLDSADHRSHLAYPTNGVCPAGYPVVIPRLSIWVMYKAAPRGAALTLSSGALDTAHADYINSWDPKTLATLEHFCFDGHRLCYKQMGTVLRKLRLKHNSLAERLAGAPPTGS
jgi:hypothetical protein